ncbi:hypothetical protein MPTK1_2g03350 [Marchantia polymorpha subsp. ruderalis]|uniref:J domain-containing protein n=1 Tax=Marchantia polymorpha TaxID=3197 RepID=A0A2R6W095_MARPO|nr:hypothetical protein MARPO_0211s0012 [Marchantia polymorpha]BBN00952.1 hypothetical protein Mp_2g03350 [Marchantia polymorpha subsp. ruderalis]|eukprot:PTQ27252.1 hypothetical protein MARPO_0211s0012 [Marchantia polymorpha]
MLSECAFPPRVPDCCIHSSWCRDSVASPPLDGLNFLESSSGRHEVEPYHEYDGAGITKGAELDKTDDGAGPSSNSGVPLVDGFGEREKIGLVNLDWSPSVMTNSDFTSIPLSERGSSEIRRECSLEEVGAAGTLGHAARENRCGFIEKRSKGLEKAPLRSGEVAKATSLKRPLQDRPEAPLRKRIHVCESNFGADEGRNGNDAAGSVRLSSAGGDINLGARLKPNSVGNGVNREGVDDDDGDEGVDKVCTEDFMEVQLEQPLSEGQNAVVDEDVEMTELDESAEHEAPDTSLLQGASISALEIDQTEDECPGTSDKVEEGDFLRPVKPSETQVPGVAFESAGREANSQHWWEGLENELTTSRETDTREQSPRVLVSDVPDEIGEFSFRPLDVAEQICDLLGLETGQDNHLRDEFEEASAGRRDEGRINEEKESSKHVDLSSEDDEPRSRNGYPHEVIEVEDSDDEPLEMNAYESDGSSTKGTKPVTRPSVPRNGLRRSTSQSTSASYSPDEESDSDDCQIVGESNPKNSTHGLQRNRADSEGQDDDSDSDDDRSEDSDSSDVQVDDGIHSEIQRGWEEAAMRRRMGRAMKSAGSKVNGEREATADLDLAEGAKSEGLAESVATSAYRDSPDSTAESSEARGGAEGFVNPIDGQFGATLAPESEGRILNETLNKNDIFPPSTEANEGDNHHLNMVNGGKSQSGFPLEEQNGHESSRLEPSSSMDVRTPTASELRRNNAEVADGDLIALRERLKQTPEFMQADEQEWASRQQELQRQQLEAQKLRQRKRVEADRKLEMERKQKQRVQELRQNQMKAEKDMDEREQLRGQVRERLENLASRCSDLASLLRRLGVIVDGGNNPSDQQVNAAFKRALVKFHPDRVLDADPRRLVEAEETFKLINRTKKTLDGYDPFR